MKILITGGAGFIGSNFIRFWLNKYPKDQIINLDALTYAGNLDNLRQVQHLTNYKFVKGDICDAKLVNRLMPGIDIVVHFAASSHVDRSILKPSDFIETNIVGTHILLNSAQEFNVKRFHHISTDEVFGSLKLTDKKKFNEQSPYQPRSPYAASKAASDHLVYSYYHTYNLPITITNCSNNYGSYQHPEKLIPLTITNLLENKKVPIYGNGLYVRDWLYVEDHCRAIEKVVLDGQVGETYCVGGLTDDITNLDLVKLILKILKKDESFLVFVKDRPGHDRKYALDWSKIKYTLGWQPLHTLQVWLEKTVDWYVNNRHWWKKIKNEQFDKYYKSQYPSL